MFRLKAAAARGGSVCSRVSKALIPKVGKTRRRDDARQERASVTANLSHLSNARPQHPMPPWVGQPARCVIALPRLALLFSVAAAAFGVFMLSSAHVSNAQENASNRTVAGGAGRTISSLLLMPALNQRPPKPQVSDQTAYASRRFQYQVPEVTDPDGDNLTYDAFQGSAYNPLPNWLTFDSDTRTFTGRQRGIHIDVYTIRVTVSDGNQVSWAEFTLSVVEAPPNRPPAAVSLTDQTADEDQPFSYVVPEFTDQDGDSLTYTAALEGGGSLPDWLSFSATTRTLSGTPLEEDTPATHTIRITASDGSESATATFDLTVQEVNDAPTKPSIMSQNGIEGSPFSYQVPEFVDPEGDDVTYAAALDDGSAMPAWLSFNASTRILSGTPQDDDTPAALTIRITAGDGKLSASVTFTLSVPEANQRPPKPQVSDQTAYASRRFQYQVPEVTDPDGDNLTYDAFQGSAYNPLPNWLTFDSDTRTFTGRQRGIHIDVYTIRVTVSDGNQVSWAEFTLSVVEAPPNRPPAAVSLTDQTADEDQPFSYVVPEFTDQDGDSLTYTAALEGGGSLPDWLSFSATTRTLSGTPLEEDTPATHTIRITATDDGEPPLSTAATFTLTVVAVNDPPVASDDTTTVAEAGSVDIASSTLLANDSDAENDTLSVTAVAGAVNGTVMLSEDKAKVTYTHDGSETSSDSFTYTVSDGTATDTATVTITVTAANDAPVAANDSASVAEGGSVDIASSTLLANDSDAENDTLSVTAVAGAVNGTVMLSEDKATVTFTHDGSETTSGSFIYTISDGTATDTATVTITVTAANDAPVASDDTATVAEGGSVDIARLPCSPTTRIRRTTTSASRP